MRRISCHDPFDDRDTVADGIADGVADGIADGVADEPPRRSRVTRLVDLPDGEGQPEKRFARGSAPMPKEEGGHRETRGARCRAEGTSAPIILSVTPEGDGEMIAVVMALPPYGTADTSDGASDEKVKKPRRVRLCLLVEQYAELRTAGVPLECGDLSEEQAALLTEAGELCEAIRRGMAALQYGDRSARRLVASLTAKGITREKAEAAVDYLSRKGYIREEDTARRRVGSDLRKGWGPRRIREDLRAQGLESEVVDAAMEELSEVDFNVICAEVIRKKYGELPLEREERQKMTAALMRLGYDLDHIRGAARLLACGTS